MSCEFSRLVLESIRTWLASTHSLRVMARIELRWMELDALCAWPALEEFLAIIFFERQRDICIASDVRSDRTTSDETGLLAALMVARWDHTVAAQLLESFLGATSAGAAASAAARFRAALARQPLLLHDYIDHPLEIKFDLLSEARS